MDKYRRPIKILIAEDDEDDRLFLYEAFNKLKILNTIKFVENGEELIDTLKKVKKAPDLIFLDLNMPIVNGFQALKIIKKDKNLKKIPIIILTTSKNEADIYRTYENGISAYIVKPFSFEDLMEAIKKTTDYYFQIVTLPSSNNEK